MNTIANELPDGCLTDEELQVFKSGRTLDNATEEHVATHLGACEVCKARLDSLPNEPDLIVDLLRAPDSMEQLADGESHDLSGDSTLSYLPVQQRPPTQENRSHEAEPLPDKIGKYFILNYIARGGFGKVYKAKDPDANRIVAIKVPRLSSEVCVEQFLKEARTAAQLQHPSIVQVFDWGREEDGSCFA